MLTYNDVVYVPFEVRKWNINSVIKRKIMEWISVKDELPKGWTSCLCYEDGNQWTCNYDGKDWVQHKEDNLPTHWMELPKPPKE